jgi:hypothetical protein
LALTLQLFACNSTLTTSTGRVITTGTPPNLLDVYNDAETLGTNVIYLGEWWSQGDQGNWGYGNRGDWIVAPSLGGAASLKKAAKELKPLGKVILYLEPFVVDKSIAGTKQIPNWQLLLGPPIPTATPLACKDCANPDIEDVNYTSKEWTAAALRFADRLRAAIRSVPGHEDAIVMGENNTGQLPFHWDGGSASSRISVAGPRHEAVSPRSHGDRDDGSDQRGERSCSCARIVRRTCWLHP